MAHFIKNNNFFQLLYYYSVLQEGFFTICRSNLDFTQRYHCGTLIQNVL